MKKIDYSSEAITRRLKRTDQLRVLSLSLIKAKQEHDEKIARENENKSTETRSLPATKPI